METVVTCSTSVMLYSHVDDICNILRALCMDPCAEVQRLACKCVSEFCNSNKELLLHFTEILARGLLLPLISKKSKVRIASLEALGVIIILIKQLQIYKIYFSQYCNVECGNTILMY